MEANAAHHRFGIGAKTTVPQFPPIFNQMYALHQVLLKAFHECLPFCKIPVQQHNSDGEANTPFIRLSRNNYNGESSSVN